MQRGSSDVEERADEPPSTNPANGRAQPRIEPFMRRSVLAVVSAQLFVLPTFAQEPVGRPSSLSPIAPAQPAMRTKRSCKAVCGAPGNHLGWGHEDRRQE